MSISLSPGWTWTVLLVLWLGLMVLVWALLRAAAWADRQAEAWGFGRKAEAPTTVVGPDDGTETEHDRKH